MAPFDTSRARAPLTTPDQLADRGLIAGTDVADLTALTDRYAVAVPSHLADLINPDDPSDPIARQVVPTREEGILHPAETADPIGDDAHSPVKGIVHRYPDRVLLKLVSACAVYCRFCFRRERVGPGGDTLTSKELDAAISYIQETPDIWEVILTGGDPFVLSPRRLGDVLARIAAIDHVAVIRIHSRVPVADPTRITPALVETLRSCGKPVYVAVHSNHARELSPEAVAACGHLADAGVPLLGQSVLLAGVNDDVETLADLFRAMVAARIKPYYLHHPDMAPGTSHFRLPLSKGRDLIAALRGRISGLCQPTYMLDLPGGHGKVPATAEALEEVGHGGWIARDHHGAAHRYDETA